MCTNLNLTGQTVLVNYNYNAGSSYATLSPELATNITSSLTCTEAWQVYTGTASASLAFVENSTAGNAIAMANSSGTNTRYWTFTISGADCALYTPNIATPIFTPPTSGCGTVKYTLSVKSFCGDTGTDEVIIKYGNNSSGNTISATILGDNNDCDLSMNISGIDNCTDKVFIEVWDWNLSNKLFSYELNSGT